MRPEYDWASERTRELIEEWTRMRAVRLLPELQPDVTATELEDGYLGRSVRTALLDAIRWTERRIADGETLPPPAGLAEQLEPDWAGDDAITPLVEALPVVDLSEAETTPGSRAARERQAQRGELGRAGRTLQGMPSTVPPPPAEPQRRGPPPLPPKRR